MAIRIACTAILKRIMAGRVSKNGMDFIGEPADVTSDVLKAVIDFVGIGKTATVNTDGKPSFEIEVRDLASPLLPQQGGEETVWFSDMHVDALAMQLAGQEHDDIHQLIWEGNPPEPWGDVWCKYKPEAKRLIDLVKSTGPAAVLPQVGEAKPTLPEGLIERLRMHADNKENTAFARSTMREVLENVLVGEAKAVAWRWKEYAGESFMPDGCVWKYASHWSTGPAEAQPLFAAPVAQALPVDRNAILEEVKDMLRKAGRDFSVTLVDQMQGEKA